VPQDGVFFAGERFTCTITFTHEAEPELSPGKQRTRSAVSTESSFPKSSTEIPDVKYGNLLNGMTRTLSLSTEFSPQVQSIRRNSRQDSIPEETKPPLAPPAESPREDLLSESGGKVNVSQGFHTHRVVQRQSSIGADFLTDDEAEVASTATPLSINTKLPRNTQSLAWCFAQIVGQFVADGNYIKTQHFDPLMQKIMYKTPGSVRSAGGGGSMGSNITHHENSMKPSPNSMPLYNTPPSILFCDEELEVGESKSFVYEILLPTVLPPSHRGKVIRFQYKLLIGIQKSVQSKVTQMVSIPFRFLNRTNRIQK
jgi:hypothetical protein